MNQIARMLRQRASDTIRLPSLWAVMSRPALIMKRPYGSGIQLQIAGVQSVSAAMGTEKNIGNQMQSVTVADAQCM